MLRRDTESQVRVCPTCGGTLAQNGKLLTCKKHGAFFAYGPQLLVRTASERLRLQEAVLPWDMSLSKAR